MTSSGVSGIKMSLWRLVVERNHVFVKMNTLVLDGLFVVRRIICKDEFLSGVGRKIIEIRGGISINFLYMIKSTEIQKEKKTFHF